MALSSADDRFVISMLGFRHVLARRLSPQAGKEAPAFS